MEAGRLGAVAIQQLVRQLYRLFRVGTFHKLNNDAIRMVVDEARGAIEELRHAGVPELSLLYDGDTVLVNGELLKANREVYEASREFGAFLGERGFNAISIGRGSDAPDVRALLQFFVNPRPADGPGGELQVSPHISLRQVDSGMLVGIEDERLHPLERVLLVYALAVLVIRKVHESVRHDEYIVPGYFKRLARQIAHVNYAERPAVLDVILTAQLGADEAKRCANAALLAAAMTAQTGASEATVARVVMSAMMGGVGAARRRARARSASDDLDMVLGEPTEEERQREPDAAAAAVLGLGSLRGDAALRAIVTRQARIRMNDHGVHAWSELVEPRIVATARRVIDLITGAALEGKPMTADAAISTLRTEADPLDHICLDLLVNGIRLFPAGTLVELTSGWRGVVLAAGARPTVFHQPLVRLVTDPAGIATRPRDIDLASGSPEAGLFGHVERAIPEGDALLEAVRRDFLQGPGWADMREGVIYHWLGHRFGESDRRRRIELQRAREVEQEAAARANAQQMDAAEFAEAAHGDRKRVALLKGAIGSGPHLSVRGTNAFLKIAPAREERATGTFRGVSLPAETVAQVPSQTSVTAVGIEPPAQVRPTLVRAITPESLQALTAPEAPEPALKAIPRRVTSPTFVAPDASGSSPNLLAEGPSSAGGDEPMTAAQRTLRKLQATRSDLRVVKRTPAPDTQAIDLPMSPATRMSATATPVVPIPVRRAMAKAAEKRVEGPAEAGAAERREPGPAAEQPFAAPMGASQLPSGGRPGAAPAPAVRPAHRRWLDSGPHEAVVPVDSTAPAGLPRATPPRESHHILSHDEMLAALDAMGEPTAGQNLTPPSGVIAASHAALAELFEEDAAWTDPRQKAAAAVSPAPAPGAAAGKAASTAGDFAFNPDLNVDLNLDLDLGTVSGEAPLESAASRRSVSEVLRRHAQRSSGPVAIVDSGSNPVATTAEAPQEPAQPTSEDEPR